MYSVCQNCKETVNKQKIDYYFAKCVKIGNGNRNIIKTECRFLKCIYTSKRTENDLPHKECNTG